MDSVSSENKLIKRDHFSSDVSEYFLSMKIHKKTVMFHIDTQQFLKMSEVIPAYHDNTTPEGKEVKKIESLNG